MKIIVMAIKLFKRHIILNCILIIELAVVTTVAVIAANMAQSSTACINTLQNSCDRILYYVNPENLSDCSLADNFDEQTKKIKQKQTAFDKKIKRLTKNYSFVKGCSEFNESHIFFDKSVFKTMKAIQYNFSEVIEEDDETAKAVQYPLQKGQWFSGKKVEGRVPCVVGGVYSGKYNVGQTITGYTLADDSGKNIRQIDFVVTGILAKPEQVLDTACSTNDETFAASGIFKSKLDTPLFIIASDSCAGAMQADKISSQNKYLYLDRSATPDRISALRKEFTQSYTFTDAQLIANEKKQLAQDVSILLPFIIMLLLVSLCGVVSMSMLTTLRNMETFKIYYITGCPRYKTIIATGVYSLFYFAGAAVLFLAVMHFLYRRTGDLMTKAYFAVYPVTVLLMGIGVICICLLSFIIPFFILRRQRPADLIRID